MSLALDDALSEIELVSLRAHTGRCAACAGFEEDLESLTRQLRNAPRERPTVEVMPPRRRRAAVRALQISAAAAAVVLAAGLGSLVGSLSSPGTTTATTALTGGADLDAMLRGTVGMVPGQTLPAPRTRPSVAPFSTRLSGPFG